MNRVFRDAKFLDQGSTCGVATPISVSEKMASIVVLTVLLGLGESVTVLPPKAAHVWVFLPEGAKKNLDSPEAEG